MVTNCQCRGLIRNELSAESLQEVSGRNEGGKKENNQPVCCSSALENVGSNNGEFVGMENSHAAVKKTTMLRPPPYFLPIVASSVQVTVLCFLHIPCTYICNCYITPLAGWQKFAVHRCMQYALVSTSIVVYLRSFFSPFFKRPLFPLRDIFVATIFPTQRVDGVSS